MTASKARRVVATMGRRIPSPVRRTLRRTAALPRARHSVRAACGLGAGTPLMVHTGRISTDRSAAVMVDALSHLPGFHLALVCPSTERDAAGALLRRAETVGVRDRLHVLARPRGMAPAFLASADLGVSGYQPVVSGGPLVPEELDEYRAAGLRIVAGNIRTIREYLAQHEAGVVFTLGSAASFATSVRRVRTERPAGRPPTPSTEPDAPPEWSRIGSTPIRLGLGTANYAGQLSSFARAICAARPDVSAELVMAKPVASFRYPADAYLHFPTERRLDVQLDQVRRVLGTYTHLVVDAFRPVLGRLNGEDISADLPALRQAKIKTALLAHGSEIRHPASHLDRHPESGFRQAPEELVERLGTVTEKNARIARESELPIFVTTPDLLADVPWATWAPLVLDVEAWSCDRPVLERPRPIVLHAPSTRWTKGTDLILPELQALHDRRVIDFRLVEGVPWSEMRRMVQEADIIVDQLVMGSYCTFACEGMAAGKAVISYLSEDAMRAVQIRPPITSATPATLVKAIESLLDDRTAAARLAAEGVGYVREHHDGRRTAQVFDEFLR
ncbi:glycosyl transferase family 1 [Plantactinospora sp. WMMC1484]|uniref:glycosyl transferase family 1 n=1 Tax=Plantactinospora sp. WMMC1484 TaxID=3404122 RepID=UPI003BF58222